MKDNIKYILQMEWLTKYPHAFRYNSSSYLEWLKIREKVY
jgi:hypothetical protein